ncbi:Muniscin C-terminal mu homology domain-containing protein [Durotheca rogersii]|uniref:Muniscin C-terminal mu homology domain-containing protein n=1 Tax=Durotheca rogersii TaxID=419775 RepID=UPI00222096A4|nr:Muniscin C-terminal mu homology domain-containing protein [Durotheca rogersii]KAI5868335.1 Muniscin C-terminal mu homology domain-containing protein [Durotheca rogersii]
MDDLSRAEYPAMLANLQPNQAVHALSDRVKRISKVNTEIADWLQERRKVEEQYVQALRRLAQFRVPNTQSELGTFQAQWDKILQSADAIAMSHHVFATKIEKDVEAPLRIFNQKKEMANMQTIQSNLQNMAKELEDAQERSDKLSRKGGKASAHKVDLAAGKLESATQQWESQAPFIFETLQALDESRMNQLRDCLTQYGTYEGERAQQQQAEAETVLNSLLDYSTASEVQHFVAKTTAGRPKIEKRTLTTRQSSSFSTGNASLALPSSATMPAPDDRSDHSVGQSENKLRSRIGTMLGRRRQSIHGGFGQLTPAKGPFGRNIKSSHGVSPRASSSNLGDSTNRLGSLVEDPDTATDTPSRASETKEKSSHDGTNGLGRDGDAAQPSTAATASQVNGTSIPPGIADVPPPPGPPPSHREPEKDADGFNVPAPANDPITQAEREAAAHEAEQLFKLNIQKEPVAEEDPEEKKAALSNVANSLSAMGMSARRAGTVRGRRDVRNTIYVPAPVSESSAADNAHPLPPSSHGLTSRSTGLSTLASESSFAGTSDTQSIRSGNSLSSIVHAKHPEMHEPGLNSSVMETISATFEHGQVQSVKVNGEVAFSYNATITPASSSHLPIRINNFPSLEVIGPNRIFVTNDTPEHPDQFSLDLSHIHKTTIGFSYRLHIDPAVPPAEHVPILVSPAWKPQGDKLGLLLQYKPNPAFKFFNAGVQLHNLVLFATYEGKASGAQTKPSGTHLKDKHLVYWRIGDIHLTPDADWQKIVCRIIGDQGVEPKPGTIEARWEFSPPPGAEGANAISVSRFEETKGKEVELSEDDPFADETATADEGRWVDVPVIRKQISGKYEAK